MTIAILEFTSLNSLLLDLLGSGRLAVGLAVGCGSTLLLHTRQVADFFFEHKLHNFTTISSGNIFLDFEVIFPFIAALFTVDNFSTSLLRNMFIELISEVRKVCSIVRDSWILGSS